MSNITYSNVSAESATQITNAALAALAKAGYKAVTETKTGDTGYGSYERTEIRVIFAESASKSIEALTSKVAEARANVAKLQKLCGLERGEFRWMDLPETDNPFARFDHVGNVVMTITADKNLKGGPVSHVSYMIWDVSPNDAKGKQFTNVVSKGEVGSYRRGSRDINPDSTAKRLVKIINDKVNACVYDYVKASTMTDTSVEMERDARDAQKAALKAYNAKLQSLAGDLPAVKAIGCTQGYGSQKTVRVTIELDWAKIADLAGLTGKGDAYMSDGEVLDALINARNATRAN